MNSIYHTALAGGGNNFLKEAEIFCKKDGSVAFFYDVTKPNLRINLFKDCDVFYTDLAWKHGLYRFNEMAGVNVGYKEYLFGVSNIIVKQSKPMFIVAGKTEGKHLPTPTATFPIVLNGGNAVVYVYNYSKGVCEKDTIQLLKRLAKEFNKVGDFCCGYGRSGRIFTDNGKKFVMSDYNKKCIGYIKDYYSENI